MFKFIFGLICGFMAAVGLGKLVGIVQEQEREKFRAHEELQKLKGDVAATMEFHNHGIDPDDFQDHIREALHRFMSNTPVPEPVTFRLLRGERYEFAFATEPEALELYRWIQKHFEQYEYLTRADLLDLTGSVHEANLQDRHWGWTSDKIHSIGVNKRDEGRYQVIFPTSSLLPID